ncbi:DUF4268 domain-containing protein [Amycolatopsis sp. NPDC001319]|uniref:caspase, EACC1-associated type n=1 Tax=unclassified Amycolatopsis TaxID=2618356 RepID=UPI0036ADAD35
MSHEPDRDHSWAVLIGTSDYESGDLQPLRGVHNNLVALERALTNPATGVFREDHCVVVDNPHSAKSFMTRLSITARRAQDVLLVYYAGHGILSGPDGDLYLAVHETDEELADNTAVKFETIKNVIGNSVAKVRILILDCCFSGRAIGAMSSTSAAVNQISAAGTFVLTSSSANRISRSVPGERYTAFTGALVNLLDAGLPQGNPEVRLHDLYPQLSSAMAEKGLPSPRQRVSDSSADVVLRRPPVTSAAPPPEQSQVTTVQAPPPEHTESSSMPTTGVAPLVPPHQPDTSATPRQSVVSAGALRGIGSGLRTTVVWALFALSAVLLIATIGAGASGGYRDAATGVVGYVFFSLIFVACSIAPTRRLLKRRAQRVRSGERSDEVEEAPVSTDLVDQRKAFYTDVFARLEASGVGIRTPAIPSTNWCDFASGPFGRYALVFSKHGYRVEMYLDTGKAASTSALFDRLHEQREEFGGRTCLDLTWERLDRARASRIAVYLEGFDLQHAEAQSRSEAAEWSAQTVQTLYRTFDTTLRSLARELKALDGQPT